MEWTLEGALEWTLEWIRFGPWIITRTLKERKVIGLLSISRGFAMHRRVARGTVDLGGMRGAICSGFWSLDSRLWILGAGFWTLDAGFWVLDSGCWILDAGF